MRMPHSSRHAPRAVWLAACLAFCAAPLPAQEKVIARPPAAAGAPGQPPPNAGQPAQPGQPGQPTAPPAVSITNIEDKQFQGPQVELKDGKLAVKSEPPQTVALD